MPPKTVFSKEAVVEAGLAALREQGLKGLTARKVARRLHASVGPLYRWFPSMEALQAEVVERVKQLMLEYASRPYTSLRFLNMGVGITIFAREEPGLFRALFLERNDFKPAIDQFLASLCDRMREDEHVADLTEPERMALLTKMWIFTHGLAALVAVGVLDDDSDAFIIDTLRSVGRVVSGAALAEFERSRIERDLAQP